MELDKEQVVAIVIAMRQRDLYQEALQMLAQAEGNTLAFNVLQAADQINNLPIGGISGRHGHIREAT